MPGGQGGGHKGYKFFRSACERCGKDVALSFTDPGYIWFRRHKPCGSFRTLRSYHELKNKIT